MKNKFSTLPVELQAKLLSEKGISASAFKKWEPRMVVDGQDGAGENEILMDGMIVDSKQIKVHREYMGDDSAITDRMFRDRLGEIEGTPRIFMNSPGGDVQTAFAIVQMIEEYDGPVECMVVQSASAASLVMAACEKVVASDNAEIMIHSARAMAYGTAAQFRKYADYLDRQNMRAVKVYDARMKQGEDAVLALMAEETFYDANEALKIGLVDEIYEPKEKSQNRNDDPDMNATTRNHLVLQIAALQAA